MSIRLPVLLLSFYAVCSLTAMAVMNIGFFVVFAYFLYLTAQQKRLTSSRLQSLPEFRSYLRYGGCLFAACLLSLTVAKFNPIFYAGHAPEITLHGFLKIWYLLCPLVLTTVFAQSGNEKNFKNIVRIWWLATAALAVLAVIQFYTGWPAKQVIPTNPDHYHAILFFGHHLSTSSIIIFPTFTALTLALGAYTRKRPEQKWVALIAASGLLILFLSYARTAWLAIPIGIILVLARHLKPKTLIASSTALLVFLALASQTPLLKERIQNSMGIRDRFRLWEANIDFFKHNPFTGIGWLKTQEMSEFYFKTIDPEHYHDYFWGHAHSNFFEMLGGTGLVGLLAFLAWSFFTLRLAFRTAQESEAKGFVELSDLSWGLGVALILLHFNGLTNVTFWEGKVMHQQMWAIALLLMIQFIVKRGKNDARADHS